MQAGRQVTAGRDPSGAQASALRRSPVPQTSTASAVSAVMAATASAGVHRLTPCRGWAGISGP